WERAKKEYDRQRAELIAPVAEPLTALQAEWEQRLLRAETHPGEDFYWERQLELLGVPWGQNLGEGQLEGLGIIKTPLAERTQDQKDRLLDYFLRMSPEPFSEKFKELDLHTLRGKLEELAKTLPPVTRAPGMMKSPVERTTHIHER